MKSAAAGVVVYAITHTGTGRRYVGHTYRFRYRMMQHQFHLNRGTHHSRFLQAAWRKHGSGAFVFAELARLDTEAEAVVMEQQEIDAGAVFNAAPAADSTRGSKRSDATRERMGVWQRGRPKPPEHRAKIAATLTGRPRDPAATAKQAERMRRVPRGPEWCKNISDAHLARSGAEPITAFGRTQHIKSWAREYGINTGTLRNRLSRAGLDLETALTAPLSRGKPVV